MFRLNMRYDNIEYRRKSFSIDLIKVSLFFMWENICHIFFPVVAKRHCFL